MLLGSWAQPDWTEASLCSFVTRQGLDTWYLTRSIGLTSFASVYSTYLEYLNQEIPGSEGYNSYVFWASFIKEKELKKCL